MLNFKYYSPTSIIFGKETTAELGAQLSADTKTVLFHYGGGSIKQSGLYDQILSVLQAKLLKIIELGGVEPNPKLSLVKEGIALCRENKVDLILAAGGGSVIDSAKAISVGVNYDGDVWDFFMGKAQPVNTVPVGVVLTLPATGSETSPNTVVTNEEGLLKRGMKSDLIRPVFAILSPELTMTLPDQQTFAGIMDILSHVFERYFTTTNSVDVTDRMCEGVMKATLENAYKLRQNPGDYDARAEIMLAGTIAHNGILGVGRHEDWASHRIGHEITALYGTTHGVTLAVIFPAWMKYVSGEWPDKFAQFATRVFDVSEEDFENDKDLAKEGIRRFEAFLTDMGLPKSFKEAGLPKDQIDLMTEKASIFGALGGYRKLEPSDIKAIYELAL